MAKVVKFVSAGLECAADLYRPAGAKSNKRRPSIVMGHGFSLVKPMLAVQAQALADTGFNVLAIDYRSFGDSGGRVRGQLFPSQQVEDFRNAISYMQSRRDVDPERIGIWGASFAGALVTYVAAVDRRVKATCAVVPVTDGYTWLRLLRSEMEFDDLLTAIEADRQNRYQGAKSARIPVVGPPGTLCGIPSDDDVLRFFNQVPETCPSWRDSITLESMEKILEFSPISLVNRISPRPYLIISTAKRDVVHPAWSVAELHEAAREPKRLCFLPFEQTELYTPPGVTVSNQVAADFFLEHLGPTD